MERYSENCKPRKGKKLILGLIFMFLGVIWLLDNFSVLPFAVKDIVFSWQMLLIGIGLINLFGRNSYFAGLVMILIGVFFLLPEIIPFSFRFTHLFWPVLLIAIGLLIIFRHNVTHHNHFHNHFHKSEMSPDNTIDEVNIFGGSKQNIVSNDFRGGKITSIFGGSEIDLTNAKLAEGKNILEMVCIFGGSSIIVPSDWHVRTEVVSILGGFADKRHNIPGAQNKERELIIKGVAIFGGGEIKSFKEF